MKRLVNLVFLIILVVLPVYPQTTLWEDSFNNPEPGWVLEGNWAFESAILVLNYYPVIINYDFSAITPEICIPENPSDLILSQFIETYPTSVTTEACEISVIAGGAEEIIWNFQLSEGNWGIEGGEDISFSLAAFSGENIKLRFRSWGPTTDAWWDWSIYRINITSFFDHDLSAIAIEGPNQVNPDETNTWQVLVKNMGLLPQTGFSVWMVSAKTGEKTGSQVFTGNLDPGDTAFLGFEWSFGSAHNTCLYGKVTAEADEFQRNNCTHGHFLRVEPDIEYQVLLWDNDNGIETIYNPETGVPEQPDAAFVKALNLAGINFEQVNILPVNLGAYDIIIATMGCYCLS